MIPVITSPENYKKQLETYQYNQVLKIGNQIKISGQGGWSSLEDGYRFDYKTHDEEIEQAFKNIEHVLNTVGSSWKDVYDVTSYHVNMSDNTEIIYTKIPDLFKKYIGERAPLWTSVGVTSLAEKKMHIEIVVHAYTNN